MIPTLDPLLRYSAVPPIDSIHRLMLVLSGIASCATSCGCCQSHNESASKALAQFKAETGISVEDAYEAEVSRKSGDV